MTNNHTKRGLGSGLSSLLKIDNVQDEENNFDVIALTSTGQDQTYMVETFKLYPSHYQPRQYFDEKSIDELAQSIQQSGIIQPILVRKNPKNNAKIYEIIAGERRWRAAQKSNLSAVPVIIRDYDTQKALQVSLIENIHREDLNAIEEAQSYKELMDDFAYTQEQISQFIGKSRSHIANIIRLLTLPEEVIQLVQNKQLSSGHARTLIGKANAVELAHQLVANKLSVRQAEELQQPKKSSTSNEKTHDIKMLEQELSDFLGVKVTIQDNANKGKVVLHYSDSQQRQLLVSQLKK